jgi:hypothetical protein
LKVSTAATARSSDQRELQLWRQTLGSFLNQAAWLLCADLGVS